MTTTAAPVSAPCTPDRRALNGWDRAAIVALGAAGCALSYDALQQMAAAIHVRGPLTYLFPLVIDGFIAFGVRALVLTRTAPFRARLYVWTLFAAATVASIWANALHAVRLNEAEPPTDLRLGDATVGILSTLAPLALAGAVHLYILIARQSGNTAPPLPLRAFEHIPTVRADVDTEQPWPPERRPGRPPGAPLETLLSVARRAVTEEGRLSRAVVRNAVRSQGIALGSQRLTEVMAILRDEQQAAGHRP